MRKTFITTTDTLLSNYLVLLMAVVALAAPACGDSDAVCEPGMVRQCPCPGTQTGVQSCSDDGNRWSACQGCPGSPLDANGEEDLSEGTDSVEPDSSTQPDQSASGPGTCSITRQACQTDADCAGSVDLQGKCIINTYGTATNCLYQSVISTGVVTCNDLVYDACDFDYQCPKETYCSGFSDSWCTAGEVSGICGRALDGGFTQCSSDGDCLLNVPDLCIECGDGVVDEPYEECDDGHTIAGDGCSPDCYYEGQCFFSDQPYPEKCQDSADCVECTMTAGSDCECLY